MVAVLGGVRSIQLSYKGVVRIVPTIGYWYKEDKNSL
jgi:hypothetical protein